MKKSFFLIILFCGSLFLSCSSPPKISLLRTGIWRGVLTLNDSAGLILPFNFDLAFQNDSTAITIHNAEEKIQVNEIYFDKDSVFIRMPVFDSEFRCRILGDTLMIGNWINHSRKDKNIIPFKAEYGRKERFHHLQYNDIAFVSGKWKSLFSPGAADSSYAVGLFSQSGDTLTGTFLTETGDYRYLDGWTSGSYLQLSCFDGSHAFLFHAEIEKDNSLNGDFWSGVHHHEKWTAWRDSAFALRNADSLTFLKKNFPKVDFTFSNLDNKKVSLSDEKFNNKVVILQIMGSWCPNCMDETMFLSEMDRNYKSKGLEIEALAFEKTDDFEKARSNVLRLKEKYNAEYEFLITGFQPKEADKALPALNHVMSFPTTIFIDKKGTVRRIHTGYSGPATGENYTLFVKKTNEFVESLLKE